jgi:Ala-tRNA(Pro) deacylase
VRGVSLASGAKAMFVKSGAPLPHGSPYALAVVSAAKGVSFTKLKKILGTKNLQLAPLDDVARLTGCVPGAVPPFGSLFPGVKTWADSSLQAQGPTINFNAGLRTHSVVGLSVADYLKIEKPEIADFS